MHACKSMLSHCPDTTDTLAERKEDARHVRSASEEASTRVACGIAGQTTCSGTCTEHEDATHSEGEHHAASLMVQRAIATAIAMAPVSTRGNEGGATACVNALPPIAKAEAGACGTWSTPLMQPCNTLTLSEGMHHSEGVDTPPGVTTAGGAHPRLRM